MSDDCIRRSQWYLVHQSTRFYKTGLSVNNKSSSSEPEVDSIPEGRPVSSSVRSLIVLSLSNSVLVLYKNSVYGFSIRTYVLYYANFVCYFLLCFVVL